MRLRLSWSQSVFELFPSSVSFGILATIFFLFCFFIVSRLLVASCLFFMFFHFFLYFRFVCIMRRCILRCVDLIIFSCSFERVHVPEAHVSVTVMTMLNKRRLCRSRYDFDVISYPYLLNDAQAALIRFLISAVSYCSKGIVCPRYFARSFTGKTYTLMLSIVTSLPLFVPWLLRIFVLSGWIFQSHTFGTLLEVAHIYL